jgi:hypothetical protein
MEVFTDGNILLRQWQLATLPRARHVLDWYHLRRRVGKLNAVVHGRSTPSQLRSADHDWLSRLAGGLMWRLWHGRAQEAYWPTLDIHPVCWSLKAAGKLWFLPQCSRVYRLPYICVLTNPVKMST